MKSRCSIHFPVKAPNESLVRSRQQAVAALRGSSQGWHHLPVICHMWGPLIAAVARVTHHTLIRSAATGLWKSREETAIYVSSVMLPAATEPRRVCRRRFCSNQAAMAA
jgi:hypothetical protein